MATAKGKRPAAKGTAAKKTTTARKRKPAKKDPLISMPAVGMILLLLGAFALVCLLTSSNAVVLVAVRSFLNGTFGVLRILIALLVVYLGIQTALGDRWPLRKIVWLQAALIVLCLMTLLQVTRYDMTMYELRVVNGWAESYNSFVWKSYEVSKNVAVGGGYVGALLAYPLVLALDTLGSILVLVFATLAVGFWLVRTVAPSSGERLSDWFGQFRDSFAERREERGAEREAAQQERAQAAANRQEANQALLVPLPDDLLAQEEDAAARTATARGRRKEPARPPQPEPLPQHPVQPPVQEPWYQEGDAPPAAPPPERAKPAPKGKAKPARAKSSARLYIENSTPAQPPSSEAYSEYDVERVKYASRPSRKDPNAIPDFILKRRAAFDAQFGVPGTDAPEDAAAIEDIWAARPAGEAAGDVPLAPEEAQDDWYDPAAPAVPEDEPFPEEDAEDDMPPAFDEPPAPSPAPRPRPYVAQDPLDRQPQIDPAHRLDRPDWKPPEPEVIEVAPMADAYRKPPFSLLLQDETRAAVDTREADALGSQKLEETLASFGVTAKVIRVVHGPAITRYELQPAPGVKVSKIVGLTDDIALNMAAVGVRIEAPIPGKAAIGIEIANEEIQTVYLRDVLESEESKRNPSKLAVALGKDVAGKRIIADLARMPHLLIAGATGSGKSVCINTLITSIIYRATPDDVRLILIDPKKVELAVYNGIPHLLVPVVTDPKKASGALAWAVQEMDERYRLFADMGVRDLKGYNAHRPEDTPMLPQIVVIIDELSDLMLVASGEVEESICRLAQLARACGIYLVIATQRPSVNVITGIIKANIPSRIAFAVSSQVDSRTILDSAGADKLLGKGDMLYAPSGGGKPMRVQGCFVSDEEVTRVVAYVKDRHTTDYSQAVLDALDTPEEAQATEDGADDGTKDALFEEAVEMAIESGQTSISMLQRRLRVGYARAGRLVDDMARKGIVGPADGAKPREVLMTREEFNLMFRGAKKAAGPVVEEPELEAEEIEVDG